MSRLVNLALLKYCNRVMNMYAGADIADRGVFQRMDVVPVVHVIDHIGNKTEEIGFRFIAATVASPKGSVQIFNQVDAAIA